MLWKQLDYNTLLLFKNNCMECIRNYDCVHEVYERIAKGLRENFFYVAI